MKDDVYWKTYFERPKEPPKKVSLSYAYQDPLVSSSFDNLVSPADNFTAEDEEGFYDGPVCSRVAVIDIDSKTGRLRSPAQLMVHSSRGYARTGEYRAEVPIHWSEIEDDKDWGSISGGKKKYETETQRKLLSSPEYNDDFISVSVFTTVIATLAFVERGDILGRQVEWAFDGKQLFVVPRAGWMDNAFYHRESRSLQLFSFAPDEDQDIVVRTALSSDIVVHEATHAVIDGIAPDLYDAITPQSLGIHEAVADITAVLFSLRSWETYHTDGQGDLPRLDQSSIYSKIAEQFGSFFGHGDSLRDVWNKKSFSGSGDTAVQIEDPHSVSEVLAGILYSVFQKSYKKRLDRSKYKNGKGKKSLLWSIDRMGSIIYQGLEWLPPGDVSFADFGRSMLAADEWRLPARPDERQWIIDEFVNRKVSDEAGLALEDAEKIALLTRTQIKKLIRHSSEVRRFVENHRELFGIKKRAKRIRTSVRLIEPRKTMLTASLVPDPVILVKASWPEHELNDIGTGYGKKREVWRGTTLVMSALNGTVVNRIEGHRDRQMTEARHAFLKRLVGLGILLPPCKSIGPDGGSLRNYPSTKISRALLSIEGGFRALHIAGESL